MAFADRVSIVGSSAKADPASRKRKDARRSGRTVWLFYHSIGFCVSELHSRNHLTKMVAEPWATNAAGRAG